MQVQVLYHPNSHPSLMCVASFGDRTLGLPAPVDLELHTHTHTARGPRAAEPSRASAARRHSTSMLATRLLWPCGSRRRPPERRSDERTTSASGSGRNGSLTKEDLGKSEGAPPCFTKRGFKDWRYQQP